MKPFSLLLIALGGGFGSVARALVGMWIPAGRLPWATITVNILGSFLIGWLMVKFPPTTDRATQIHGLAIVGFCGGFTTFSAFSWQTFEQMQKGEWGAAVTNVIISIFLCLLATWMGWRLAR